MQFTGVVKDLKILCQRTKFKSFKLDYGSNKKLKVTCRTENIKENDFIKAKGSLKKTKYGEELCAISVISDYPKNFDEIRTFLLSESINGFNKIMGSYAISLWGDKTIEVIKNNPEKLLQIRNINEKNFTEIITSFIERYEFFYETKKQEKLLELNVSEEESFLIYKKYGDESEKIIKESPHSLYIDGFISFSKAEKIHIEKEINKYSEKRLESLILKKIDDCKKNGSTVIEKENLCESIINFFNNNLQEKEILSEQDKFDILLNIDNLIKSKKIASFHMKGKFYIQTNKDNIFERSLIEKIKTIQKVKNNLININKNEINKILDNKDLKFTKTQKKAIFLGLNKNFSIIHGDSGTGKTTTLKAIIDIFTKKFDKKVLTLTPTAQSAQLITMQNSIKVNTIYSILTNKESINKYIKDVDLIIIDEASMLDMNILYNLLSEVDLHKIKIILSGDYKQLLSINSGSIFYDLINSKFTQKTYLNKNHRYNSNSEILKFNKNLNKGIFEIESIDNKKDFIFMDSISDKESLNILNDLIENKIKQEFGFDVIDDLQIITNNHNGILGTKNINHNIQNILTEKTKYRFNKFNNFNRNNFKFKIGDKVIQNINNKKNNLSNGEIGYVSSVNHKSLFINFNGKIVSYDYEDVENNLLPAYCLTIHKNHGCEKPIVIIPISSNIKIDKKIIYSATSRGTKMVILIGKKSFLKNIINKKDNNRITSLS